MQKLLDHISYKNRGRKLFINILLYDEYIYNLFIDNGFLIADEIFRRNKLESKILTKQIKDERIVN